MPDDAPGKAVEILAVTRDCEELCPDALVLNYTNPMSILTLAALRATDMQARYIPGWKPACFNYWGTATATR